MKFLVFVYGTLMKGLPLEYYLNGSEASEFVGKAKTKPEFTMIKLEYFPALVRVGNSSIEGELYLVSENRLRLLDSIERNPDLYRREVIVMDDGTEAYAYLLPIVQSGNWRDIVFPPAAGTCRQVAKERE